MAVPEPEPLASPRGELVHPQLVEGGGVAWVDQECVRDCELEYDYVDRTSIYQSRRDGSGRIRLLRRTYPGYAQDGIVSFGFSLSREAMVLVRGGDTGNRYFPDAAPTYTIRAGQPLGPLASIGTCGSGFGRAIAVGAGLLYADGCMEGGTRVVLRGLDGSSRVLWSGPLAVASLQARGGYALFTTTPRSDTYDPSQSQVVLERLADGAEVGSWTTPSEPDLGDRGDVLLTRRDNAHCARSTLHRPGRAEGEPVPLPGCVRSDVRWSAGRAWFVSSAGREQVMSADVSGNTRTHVELGGTGASDVLVDERSLGWVSQGCSGRSVLRVVAVAAQVAPPRSTRCPVRGVAARAPVRRNEFRQALAYVELHCPRGCSGELGIRARSGRTLHGFTKLFQQGGRRGRHPVILGNRAVRLLRRRGRLAAMVRVRRTDRAAPQPGPRDFPVTLVR